MKKDIHPEYHNDAVITCSCGNKITVGSTQKEMHVEVCSECHPFYTGAEKVMDTAGRVEKFKARVQAAEEKSAEGSKSGETKTKKNKSAQESSEKKNSEN